MRLAQQTFDLLRQQAATLHYHNDISLLITNIMEVPIITDASKPKVDYPLGKEFAYIKPTTSTLELYRDFALQNGFSECTKLTDYTAMVLNSIYTGYLTPNPWPDKLTLLGLDQSSYDTDEIPMPYVPPSTYNDTHFLSEQAVTNLVALAGEAIEYTPLETISIWRPKEMSLWLRELSTCSFKDSRPPAIVEQHAIKQKFGMRQIWATGEPRMRVRFTLDEESMDNYRNIALQFSIHPHGQLTANAIASAVIEAIGIGWLEPTE